MYPNKRSPFVILTPPGTLNREYTVGRYLSANANDVIFKEIYLYNYVQWFKSRLKVLWTGGADTSNTIDEYVKDKLQQILEI